MAITYSQLQGFTRAQQDTLLQGLARARQYLNVVVSKLASNVVHASAATDQTRQLVQKVFHIGSAATTADPIGDALACTILYQNFRRLRASLDETFNIVQETRTGILVAWVVGVTDPTVHIRSTYFDLQPDQRAITLVHERSHTVLRAPGHPGTGDTLMCITPHEGIPSITRDQAMANAYCYELLTQCLQPSYTAARFRLPSYCTVNGRG